MYDIYDLNSGSAPFVYSTAPNGIIGISVVTHGECSIQENNLWRKSETCAIYGLTDKPDQIQVSANFREIAFGFKPFFFQLLTKERMGDVVSQGNMDASLVFENQSVLDLIEKIKSSKSDVDLLNAIESFVVFHYLDSKFDARVLKAMDLIYTKNIYHIDSISKHVNLSTTSLRNLFHSKIGRSPKAVSNIIRMNKTLKNFSLDAPLNLQNISFENGYFDQSHFINDFKKTLGCTPKQYFSNERLTFEFYNYGRWTGNILAENY